jgi:hypothetical protein
MAVAQQFDAESANVRPAARPRAAGRVVVAGAHLDSWDVGSGAHDDGAGCAIVMEAVMLLKRLDLAPRRTLRVVLFADEEMTQQGGRGYARDHADELPRHRAALECDSGGYAPAGFTVQADWPPSRLPRWPRPGTAGRGAVTRRRRRGWFLAGPACRDRAPRRRPTRRHHSPPTPWRRNPRTCSATWRRSPRCCGRRGP